MCIFDTMVVVSSSLSPSSSPSSPPPPPPAEKKCHEQTRQQNVFLGKSRLSCTGVHCTTGRTLIFTATAERGSACSAPVDFKLIIFTTQDDSAAEANKHRCDHFTRCFRPRLFHPSKPTYISIYICTRNAFQAQDTLTYANPNTHRI